MKTAIVGSTGFVGSNLTESYPFEYQFHSKNIVEAFGLEPDLLVYAGVRAEMFLANQNPGADMELIQTATENIRMIAPKRIVLISTAAIYRDPCGVNEDSVVPLAGLSPYGLHRYFLESWVRDHYKEHLVIHLPALYGKNLKKNFLYDFIHVIPKMLKPGKYEELAGNSQWIREAYYRSENSFYVCKTLEKEECEVLKREFLRLHFTALNFTDSRSRYQFYNLAHLWNHIQTGLEHGIRKLNLATEPVLVSELYRELTGKEFVNHLPKPPYNYDMRTNYAGLFGGENGYIYDKKSVIREIRNYIGDNQ